MRDRDVVYLAIIIAIVAVLAFIAGIEYGATTGRPW